MHRGPAKGCSGLTEPLALEIVQDLLAGLIVQATHEVLAIGIVRRLQLRAAIGERTARRTWCRPAATPGAPRAASPAGPARTPRRAPRAAGPAHAAGSATATGIGRSRMLHHEP